MTWTDRAPLDRIVRSTLRAGTVVRRCYRVDFDPNGFWAGQDLRFGAAPRAMLYTGDTDTAAVGETLLRDPIPFPGTNHVAIPYDHVRNRGIATLRLTKDATMVSLRRPAITTVIQDPQHLADVRNLIETTAGYGETERFARALLRQMRDLDVLAWPSRRVDGQTVYCFYEGAISQADFDVVDQAAFNTQLGYQRLVDAVAAAGLLLIRSEKMTDAPHDDP